MISEKVKNIFTINGDTATILLYEEIGGENGISGSAIAGLIYQLDAEGVKKCNLRINSPGGLVSDSYSIYSAITQTKMRVDTYNDGIACSCGAWLLMAGKKVYMADYSLLMIHPPEGGEDMNVLDMFKNSIAQIISNKIGKPVEEVNTMMSQETWFDANSSLAMGFCDEIYSTASKPKLSNKMDVGQTFKEIRNFLKLNNQMSQEEIDRIKSENSALEKSNKELQEKLTKIESDIQAERTAQLEASANELVETAIADGKITEEVKNSYLALAKADLKNTKDILSKIQGTKIIKSANLADVINPEGKSFEIPENRKDWGYRQWEKEDPKALAKLRESSPDYVKNLYQAFVESVKK